jgi:hypothetical protein
LKELPQPEQVEILKALSAPPKTKIQTQTRWLGTRKRIIDMKRIEISSA